MLNKICFFLLAITISSSFLFIQKEEVNAAPCKPGNYSAPNEKTGDYECKQIQSNSNKDVNTNALTKIDYSKDPTQGNGPMWAQKASRYFVTLSIIVGYATEAVSIIMVSYAAFIYTTSEGEPKKLRQAKMIILYAFIGMFIGLFALTISNVVGGAL